MSARFVARPSRSLVKSVDVIDRKTEDTVAYCNDARWAQMIADGLNMIVDQVAPLSPGAAHIDVTYGGKALVLGAGDTIEHGTRRVELS